MSSYKPIKIAYSTHEPKGGADASLAPVIFLHGVTASKEVWQDIPQQVANATKRKVYNVDSRNHGDSEWTDEFGFQLLKQDVLHFMETIKCSKAIFISYSMGARTIIQLAVENPDKVEKIVVEDMMVRKPGSHLFGFTLAFATNAPKALEHIPKGATEDEATKIILETVCDTLPKEKVEKMKLLEMDKSCIGLKKTADGGYAFKANLAVLAKVVQNADSILTEPKGRFDGPALFVYGKASPFKVWEEVDHIKEHFPNVEFHGIDDALHCVHQDKPKEALDTIVKFLLK